MTRPFEVDLAGANIDKLEKALAPFIQVAREVVKRPTTNTQASLIRAWAVTKGIAVPQKGRIPAAITEQYEAEQAALSVGGLRVTRDPLYV